jgi:hypothetical protein
VDLNHIRKIKKIIFSNKKIIVIGQAPGKGPGQIGDKISRGTWKHLSELFGVPYEHLDSIVGRFNLCPKYIGKNEKGDAFDKKLGDEVAEKICLYLWKRKDPLDVIFLGRNVAKCFKANWDFALRFPITDKLKFSIIPHPSMVNRFWNEKKNVNKIKKFLKKIIEENNNVSAIVA